MSMKPITETQTQTRQVGLSLPPFAYRGLRALCHAVNRAYWRVTVEGAEVIPATGPVILAPVHRSNIDFLVVSEVTRRKLFYMAKDSLWRAPRFGTFLESIGAFPRVILAEGEYRALARNEGILPALESSHAVAKGMEMARTKPKDHTIVVCLSGRGDKDAAEIARLKGRSL